MPPDAPPDARAVEELFHALIERPVSEWEAYLDDHCPDPEVRREALSLARHFADLQTRVAAKPIPAEVPPLGPYRPLARLGEGGFGSVYWAVDSATRGLVAVKVYEPKPLADRAAVAARFATELAILVALRGHPNVVNVYAAEPNQFPPYFAMEWVNGQTLLAACDGRRLGLRDRLRLFRDLCEAVGQTHRRNVFHCDLKPGNVLVHFPDGGAEPRVKLIDFGIAMFRFPQIAATAMTEGAVYPTAHTPQYASPEQRNRQPLTFASDVYSLGVILHELLTGMLPTGAVKPSTAVAVETGSAACEKRRTTPRELRRLLAADLDAVVVKALQQNPCDRYQTVADFDADIGRYLAGEPLSVRLPAPVYVARKWVRRNRVAVLVSAAFLALAAWGVTQSVVARADRDEAHKQRALAVAHSDAADRHAADAEAQKKQAEASRDEANRQTTEAKGQRARAEENLRVADKAIRLLTDVRFQPDRPEHSRLILQQRIQELRKELLAHGQQNTVLKYEYAVASVRLGGLTTRLGPPVKAIPAYEEAERTFDELHTADADNPLYQRELAGSAQTLGVLYLIAGDAGKAVVANTKALGLRTKLAARYPDDLNYQRDLAASHNSVGVGYADAFTRTRDPNMAKLAEVAYRHVISIAGTITADDRAQAGALGNLANLFRFRCLFASTQPDRDKFFAEALALYVEADKAGRVGPSDAEHLSALGRSALNLCGLCQTVRKFDQGADACRRAADH